MAVRIRNRQRTAIGVRLGIGRLSELWIRNEACTEVRIKLSHIRPIEQVEELRYKIQSPAFTERKVFDGSPIEHCCCRSLERISTKPEWPRRKRPCLTAIGIDSRQGIRPSSAADRQDRSHFYVTKNLFERACGFRFSG